MPGPLDGNTTPFDVTTRLVAASAARGAPTARLLRASGPAAGSEAPVAGGGATGVSDNDGGDDDARNAAGVREEAGSGGVASGGDTDEPVQPHQTLPRLGSGLREAAAAALMYVAVCCSFRTFAFVCGLVMVHRPDAVERLLLLG